MINRFLSLSLAFVSSASALLALSVGQPAPSFSLTDLSGATHSLDEYKGKLVVLEWTNPECPFVVKHYSSGNMPKLQKEITAAGGVWLTINSNRPGSQGAFEDAEVKAWLAANQAAPTAYLRDSAGQVGRSYAAKVTPHIYVINPAGSLVYAGAIDSIRSAKIEDIAKAENYVLTAVKAVQAGEMPAKAQTNPYGCGIKY